MSDVLGKKVNLGGILVLLFVTWLVLFWDSVMATVAIWERSETFAHCFLILPICIYLLHRDWHALKVLRIQPNCWLILPLFATLILWLFGDLAHIAAIEQIATFMTLPLLCWMVLGNQLAARMWFVLLFWMFSVPEGEFLIPWLQEVTADFTVMAIQLTGIPVYREGLYIAVPGGLFEVAVACSGIRYLIASLTLGCLFAYLTYQKWHKRLLFVLFSLVLPIIANGIRAYGIVMIAYLSDMEHATGADHLVYGWLFFGVVIFIMFSVGSIWRDLEPEPDSVDTDAVRTVSWLPLIKGWGSGVLLILSAMAYNLHARDVNYPAAPDIGSSFELRPAVMTQWQPVFQNPGEMAIGRYQELDLYVAWYAHSTQDSKLISSVNQHYNRSSWTRVGSQAYPGYQMLEISGLNGRRRMLAYTYVTEWMQSPSSLKVRLSQAVQALVGQSQQGMVLIISRVVDNDEQRRAFRQQAQQFFAQNYQQVLNDNR
ncbi:exosortase A [Lacimicrobium sp. SS2-24]|uniref:exosortase A n=1 Tax=Lacimicrobium sp. SS2-24 TaxID=2005569 RepID=UPI000B4B1D8C|nr:exosortase A [Lacimicrobium sp. SS2-24]